MSLFKRDGALIPKEFLPFMPGEAQSHDLEFSWPIGRRDLIFGGSAFIGIGTASWSAPSRIPKEKGFYHVRLLSIQPLRIMVLADLPINGDLLEASDSYPSELPQMESGGWPALMSGIVAMDSDGKHIGLTPLKERGWRLSRAVSGQIHVRYLVDFDIFSRAAWPSPLELAVVDDGHAAVSARALFLTTEKMTGADVSFELPNTWLVSAPWPSSKTRPGAYHARTTLDLTDNFIAFSTRPSAIVSAAGFRLQITAMGHWRSMRSLIHRVLQTIVSREVALMGYVQREAYNVVLVPTQDTGGEAYRQSFVYGFKNPSEANRAIWANTMAHEIFHYWNYARLQGADYASTQWFQEGFTEYIANRTVVGGGIISPDEFLAKLSEHVANYRRLTTTLEAIGTHKGPPLYSAGALVGMSFDVMLRKATAGHRNIGTFFRNLWRYTGAGERKYSWSDIEAALRETADLDWRGFYTKHIRGTEPLPLKDVFHNAGLVLLTASDGSVVVAQDPLAEGPQRAIWKQLIS